MSPTTTSRLGISVTWPSRTTLTGVSSLVLFSTSNFFIASYSNQKATPVARKIAQKIPIASANSLWMNPMPSESRAATSRMRITGSLNFSKKSLHSDLRLGGVSTLAPYRCRLCSTSAPVSPFGWFDMTVLRLNDAIAWPGPCVRTGLMTEAVRFGADGIRISAPFSFVSAPGQRYKNSAGEKRTVVFRKTGVYGRERKIEKSLVPRPDGKPFVYGVFPIRSIIHRARSPSGRKGTVMVR